MPADMLWAPFSLLTLVNFSTPLDLPLLEVITFTLSFILVLAIGIERKENKLFDRVFGNR